MSRLQSFIYFRSRGLSLFDSLDYSDLGFALLATVVVVVLVSAATYFLYLNPAVLAWIWRVA